MDHLRTGVGVLDKAMLLLDLVTYRGPISFIELTAATGMPRSTLHRLVASLEQHGFVRRDPEGRLVTGDRHAADALPAVAQPVLDALTTDTGESSQLYVRRGGQRLCVASAFSDRELRTNVAVGSLIAGDRGSGGRILNGDGEALERGWTQSAGERAPGIASVSAPVYDGDFVIAAVSMSGPMERLGITPGPAYADRVMLAARQLEAALHDARRR